MEAIKKFFQDEPVPPFSDTGSRYDLTTYAGRLKHFLSITDPRTLLKSDQEIADAVNVLQEYKSSHRKLKSDELMWETKKIVDSAVHPATGEIINPLVRVSAIAAVNIPIVFGMLACPAANVPATLFLHFVNQSYNTACNYANRSGKGMAMEDLMKAYGLAVTSACGFAYGLGRMVQKNPNRFKKFGILIPCIATAAANVSNIGFTRIEELTKGATVKDGEGNEVGVSKIAGLNAVSQTALTRCVLVPCSVLLLPTALIHTMKTINLLPRNAKVVMGAEILAIYACFQLFLPAALALYPQTTAYEPKELEAEFHNVTDKLTGKPLQHLYANKGL